MYVIFSLDLKGQVRCHQVRASSVADLCYADSSLAWLAGSHAAVATSESEEQTVTGGMVKWAMQQLLQSETSTSIPLDFPQQNGDFETISKLLYFPGTMPSRAPISRHRCVRSALSHLPQSQWDSPHGSWKISQMFNLEHHLYRSLHMLRFSILILALAHICMSRKSNSVDHFPAWQRGEKTKVTESCTLKAIGAVKCLM